MTKDELIQMLREKELLVSFTKKDGSQREMRCTLKSDVIPAVYGSSPNTLDHLITVYDLDKQDWRYINLTGDVTVGG